MLFLAMHQFASAQIATNTLMQAHMQNSLEFRWQKKEVFESILIDDCEELETWESGGQAKISLNSTHLKEGRNSIQLATPVLSSDSSAPYPISYLEKRFKGDDWESYNRISVWIYAEHKNREYAYLSVELKNKGTEKVPDIFRKRGRNYVKVETNQWNRVLWEIPALPRDKVVGLGIVYTINEKPFAGVGDSLYIYIDHIELQKVNADYEEGWQVAPGKIAFSHTGYLAGGNKTAITNGIGVKEFSIIEAHSGEKVLTKEVSTISSRFGEFQGMDFSDLRKEGEYLIEAGEIRTRPFKISNQVWTGTIWKNLNFWYTERCGQIVPGIHDNCHRDVYVKHGDKKIVVNGGWHDAGDLTQMIYNTADAVYVMLSLAEHLKERDTELYNQLTEEGRWGLEWLLKTRFGKGYRHNFGGISKWTDGIIGTVDDYIFEAKNQPLENFLSATVLSKASLFFKTIDPALSESCLKAAREDWEYAEKEIGKFNVELCGTAVLASATLFELTDDPLYKERSVEWADILVNSQCQSYPDWEVPLVGFFYKDTDKKQILRYNPIGNDQAPILALEKMCKLFPDHGKWIEWYAAIVLYAEYIKGSADLSNPFQMIPQSIYHMDEVHTPSVYGLQQSTLAKYEKYEEKVPQYKEQVKNGLPLGDGNYLRTFPVWYTHRGSAGIQLAQAKGLAVASHLRNDMAGINLAEKQLQWLVGRNPFTQSTMYGEGYDFAPFYFVSSGPIVGSLACGIQTDGNKDIPNWPASNCYNYKEIWTHTASRWLWLMEDLNGAARVAGIAGPSEETVEIIELVSGDTVNIKSDEKGEFHTELAAGRYEISYNNLNKELTLLPGRDYKLDFSNSLDYSVSTKDLDHGGIEITVSASGKGKVKFELRGFNVSIGHPVQTVQLTGNKQEVLRWKAEVSSANKPWIAVVIANDDLSTKKEISN